MLVELEGTRGFYRHSDISSIGDMDYGMAVWFPVLHDDVVVETFLFYRNGCFQLCDFVTLSLVIKSWV